MAGDRPRATRIRPDAQKQIKRLQPDMVDAVLEAIERLRVEPLHSGTEGISGAPPARRVRVREHRIEYVATDDELVVLDILPRGDAYTKKNLERLKVLVKSAK